MKKVSFKDEISNLKNYDLSSLINKNKYVKSKKF